MNIIYNIIQHFSDNWRDYITVGAVTGFLFLSAVAGNYDGREIENKPRNKRDIERLIKFPKP